MEELIKIDENIKNKIYIIRGKQVMLDSDLAEFYKCKNGTKTINQAVNRHKGRFPSDFYFQLTVGECLDISRSQVGTLKIKQGHNVKYLPYAFTEEGVAMLSSVIRTEVASEISVQIMRTFVSMRHYLYDNQDIYKTLNYINNKMIEHDEKLDKLFSYFDRKEKLFLDGTEYDSHSYVHSILKEVKKEVIIIDPYADLEMLDMIKDIDAKIILIMKNKSLLSDKQISKFNKNYDNKLSAVKNDKFHDRYIILDRNTIYHLGTSINYLGKRVFSITLLEDKIVKSDLLNFLKNVL